MADTEGAPAKKTAMKQATAQKSDPSVASRLKTLQLGDRDRQVVRAKALLNTFGNASLSTSSDIYDRRMEMAVTEHQEAARIPQTGVIDKKTWLHLLTG